MSWSRRYGRRLYYYGADGGSFDPSDLTKVASWYRVDGDPTDVADLLGGPALQQGTTSLQPTLGASNGHDILIFDGVDDRLDSTAQPSAYAQTQKRGVAGWIRSISPATNDFTYGSWSVDHFGLLLQGGSGNDSVRVGGSASGSPTSQQSNHSVTGDLLWHFYYLAYDGTIATGAKFQDRLTLYIDGVALPITADANLGGADLFPDTLFAAGLFVVGQRFATTNSPAHVELGRNLFLLTDTLTADEQDNLMRFESPIVVP